MSLSQSAWNIRFYFGHQKPCMDNNDKYCLDGMINISLHISNDESKKLSHVPTQND